jgi:hypothetical protein
MTVIIYIFMVLNNAFLMKYSESFITHTQVGLHNKTITSYVIHQMLSNEVGCDRRDM